MLIADLTRADTVCQESGVQIHHTEELHFSPPQSDLNLPFTPSTFIDNQTYDRDTSHLSVHQERSIKEFVRAAYSLSSGNAYPNPMVTTQTTFAPTTTNELQERETIRTRGFRILLQVLCELYEDFYLQPQPNPYSESE